MTGREKMLARQKKSGVVTIRPEERMPPNQPTGNVQPPIEPPKPEEPRKKVRGRDRLREAAAIKEEQEKSGKRVTGHARVVKAAAKKKKVSFPVARMWISTLLSYLERDRGSIPSNIGNNVLITNNMYVTHAYLTSIIQILYLSLDTPETFLSAVVDNVRENASTAIVDITITNVPYEISLKESGMPSRIRMWEYNINQEHISDYEKEIAARCLYTIDELKSGKRLYRSRIFLSIRAKTGTDLVIAEKIVGNYLQSIGASYMPIKSNIQNILQYISIFSGSPATSLKDIKSVITSSRVLSQLLPNSGSPNDSKGLYCGVNVLNNSEFKLDVENITVGRNIYILAPSGVGKTVLLLNMAASAVEQGMAACIMDIKGNEISAFVRGVGGYVISLRQSAVEYINKYRLRREDTTDELADIYYKSNVAFCKRQLVTLVDLQTREFRSDLDEFLDRFLQSVYVSLGVLPNNRNTWAATENLNPFVIYDMLVDYTTPEVMQSYPNVAKKAVTALRMYMSREGSKSYIFTKEFDYADIMKAPAISFDFGILTGGSLASVDPVIFTLRFNDMRQLNADYTAYKFSRGIKIFKGLEEVQSVSDEVLQGYVEEYTLRRSQGQTTVLLGNSITALTANPISRPLIENVKGIFIGALAPEAREEAIKQFDLRDKEELLKSLGKGEYSNSFVFINRMQPDALTPVLRVILDPQKKYKLYTPEKERNVSAV